MDVASVVAAGENWPWVNGQIIQQKNHCRDRYMKAVVCCTCFYVHT